MHDTIINTGGIANLIAVTSSPGGVFSWTPDYETSCDDCQVTTASPQDSTMFTVTYIDENGVSQSKVGVEYDSIKIRYQKDSITFDGDIREYAKVRPIENTYKQYRVTNLFVDDDNDYKGFGQVNRVQVSYMNDSDILKISDEMGPGDSIEFCAQKDSVVPPLGWLGRNVKIVELGDCWASDIVIGVDPRPDIKYDREDNGQELTTIYSTGPNGEVTSEEIIIDTRIFR